MNLRNAILHALTQYPDFYLAHEPSLFIEATNRAALVFTLAEMQAELNALESSKLVIGQRVHGEMQWKRQGSITYPSTSMSTGASNLRLA